MFINLLVFLVFLSSQENELSNDLSNEFTNIENIILAIKIE